MPWWLGSIVANVAVICIEWLNHAGGYGSWARTLLRTGPLIVVAQWGLYKAFSGADHWLWAWAVFTMGNALMRVSAVALFSGNQVGSWAHVMAGMAVMILGSLVLKEGLR